MKGKLFIIPGLIATVALIFPRSAPARSLPASPSLVASAAMGWVQINTGGFGTPANNFVQALAPFNGQLYAGTYNDGGAQLWRRDASGTWSNFQTITDAGFDHLFVFNGKLYASTEADPAIGAKVYRSDGTTWDTVVTGGFGDPNNAEVIRMAAFGNKIYASTWSYTTSHGTEIYRSDTGNSGTWTRVVSNGFNNDANNTGAVAFETFNSHLYAGTQNGVTGGEVWRTNDGTHWSQANTDGFGDANNNIVTALAAFNGYLYAGTYHAAGSGSQVWRCQVCDNTDWTKVVDNGFGSPDARGMNALETFNGQLYFVVANKVTGMEVHRTADGTDWEQVGFGGFGDSKNLAPYWDNSVIVSNNNLFIGTWNNTTGGQVWESANQLYLPFIRR